MARDKLDEAEWKCLRVSEHWQQMKSIMMETAQDVYGMSEDQHGHKKTWWNEEVAEGLREKKTSMEIGREKTQKRCGRSTRRVDKMQRELFHQQRKKNRKQVAMVWACVVKKKIMIG